MDDSNEYIDYIVQDGFVHLAEDYTPREDMDFVTVSMPIELEIDDVEQELKAQGFDVL